MVIQTPEMDKSQYKYEWHAEEGEWKSRIFLRVDENSTPLELENEIEYWAEQVSMHNIDGLERKMVYAAIKWMMMISELNTP